MHRKHALDAFAVRNPANGKRFIQPAALPADHDPGENLNTLLVAFHHSSMDSDGIADAKLRQLGFELFFLDGVDDAVHDRYVVGRAQAQISDPGYISGRSISADTGGTQVPCSRLAQSRTSEPRRQSAVATKRVGCKSRCELGLWLELVGF